MRKKYFTASDYNEFTGETLNAKIKRKELVNKSQIFNLVKNSDLNAKLSNFSHRIIVKRRAK